MSGGEVDRYLATLDGLRHERVAAVVAAVRAIGGVDETIEHGMPTFRRDEAYFAVKSQKTYVSLYLGCRPALADRVAASDPKLKHGKGCVNVTDARPLPIEPLRAALAELFA